MTIFINWSVFWSIKCQKKVKSVHPSFSTSNLFATLTQDIQFREEGGKKDYFDAETIIKILCDYFSVDWLVN